MNQQSSTREDTIADKAAAESSSTSLQLAEQDVQRNREDFQESLDQLKNRIERGVTQVRKYSQAAKNPVIVIAVLATLGVFFGQVIKMSFDARWKTDL